MALVLVALFILLAVLGRVLLHYKIAGDHGLRPAKQSSPYIVKLISLLFGASFIAICISVIKESIGAPAILTVPNTVNEWCGLLVGVLGIALTVYSQYQMGRDWRIGVDESEKTDLVKHGIYSHVRNPIYTGVMVFCMALVLLNPGILILISCVCVFISIELQVRLVEEPHLQRLHGNKFTQYKNTTGSYFPSWRGTKSPNKGM